MYTSALNTAATVHTNPCIYISRRSSPNAAPKPARQELAAAGSNCLSCKITKMMGGVGGEWNWNVVLIWGGRWGWGVEEVGESVTKCGCVGEAVQSLEVGDDAGCLWHETQALFAFHNIKLVFKHNVELGRGVCVTHVKRGLFPRTPTPSRIPHFSKPYPNPVLLPPHEAPGTAAWPTTAVTTPPPRGDWIIG
jgi:hypothetical protein